MNVPNPPYGIKHLTLYYIRQKSEIHTQRQRKEITYDEYKIMLANLDSEFSVRKQVLKDRDHRNAQKIILDKIIERNSTFAPFEYGLDVFFSPSRI
jgi:hypothetical protein